MNTELSQRAKEIADELNSDEGSALIGALLPHLAFAVKQTLCADPQFMTLITQNVNRLQEATAKFEKILNEGTHWMELAPGRTVCPYWWHLRLTSLEDLTKERLDTEPLQRIPLLEKAPDVSLDTIKHYYTLINREGTPLRRGETGGELKHVFEATDKMLMGQLEHLDYNGVYVAILRFPNDQYEERQAAYESKLEAQMHLQAEQDRAQREETAALNQTTTDPEVSVNNADSAQAVH